MDGMFWRATSFNGTVSSWNVSKVTDMDGMFYTATAFNQPLSEWDVSQVTTMNSMFRNADAFNQDLNDWNVPKVTRMNFMFNGATVFNQPLSGWNVSKVTGMSSMFQGATVFNQPLSGWDVSQVTTMSSMFRDAAAFNQDLNDWNVPKVTDMNFMFRDAAAFDGDLSGWDVSKVTGMSGMFNGASDFNQPLSSWNVSQVTDMSSMFLDADAFNQPLSGWDVSQVTNMGGMFSGATVFNQPLSGWNVSKVTHMGDMFSRATVFNQSLSGWNVSKVTHMSDMFSGATVFNQPLSSWDVSKVTGMSSMFQNAAAFNGDVSSWNVSQVTGMSGMFREAAAFNKPLSGWDVSQVAFMTFMFSGATSFDQNLGKWYVVPADTAYATSEDTLSVTTISAQNSVLDGHSPEYDIGSGDDSALFNMTGNVLTFKDTPSAQDYTVTVTAPGGDFGTGNSRTLTVTVTAGADDPDRPFITTWETTTANENVTIPGEGTYAIDWGDGDTDENVEGPQTHQYDSAGNHTVKITGDLERFHLDGNSTNAPKLQSIEQWGDIEWTSMEGAFQGASNMVYNATDEPDLSMVTDMTNMFRGADAFDGNLSGWDVSQVTDMTNMFRSADAFDGNLSGWDVSQVTDMNTMFAFAAAFNQPLSSWDVSNVTNMTYMFAPATAFNQDLSNWNTSSVTRMFAMFNGATSFNGNVSSWDVSQVTDMRSMFRDTAFNQPLSGWNVSQVTDMRSMFSRASAFDGNVSGWDVSSVTDMSFMFSRASAFDGNVSGWDVSSVTDMSNMFSRASAFNQPLSGWSVSTVTDMNYMFREAADFNQDLSSWDVSQVTDMRSMFRVTAFNQPLNGWDVSKVTDMSYMFYRASDFNGNVSSWNVSQVTNMNSMFRDATAFNQPLNGWDVSKVTDMYYMFREAADFNQPLSGWDVSQVTNMNSMFGFATAFNQDISGWNVSRVTNMNTMFAGASSFQQNLGKWYVVPADTAYATSEGTLNVTTVSAQNSVLDGHSPEYGIGSGGNSDLFTMDGDVLVFKDTPSARDYTVTVTAPGGDFGTGNSRTLTVTVTADADDPDRPFITTWETTTANETITIPGTGTYTIDWGDDTPSTSASGSASHTYAEPGTYTVKITGGLERFNLNNDRGNAPKLQSIEQWGDMKWTSMEGAFWGAANMVYNATDAPDLSGVNSTAYMFSASSFNGNVSDWDVSSVTDMNSMFYTASAFNGEISGWDVSSVTDMDGMFTAASAFNQPLSDWDVSSVTDMGDMFRNSAFNQPLSDWDVSSVTDMNAMFRTSSSFDQDLSGWNVSSVTDMSLMFYSASAFNGDISGWDVSSVNNMNAMFRGASAFNGEISGWNVSQVANMNAMFYSASAFNQDISGWDVSQVGDMNTMFDFATAFDQNLGKWYIVPADTAYATSEGTLSVTTISAQNSVLAGHSPNYGIGSGGDSALFDMTGSTLMFEAAPSARDYTVTVTAPGGDFGTGNSRTLTVTVTADTDNTPPTITLEGADPYTIQAGSAYDDPGYSCADETDAVGDLRLELNDSGLDVNTPGTYTVTYTCTDLSGNVGTATREVKVVAAGADNNPPTITLDGANQLTVTVGSAYEDAGATCTDETDGPLQVTTTGTANTDTPGTYHITYACTDSSGNESTATRQVRVVAVGPPEDNNPPRVNAGPDQTVGEGDTVALSGSAADPDAGDSVVSYSWSAPQGSGITFADGSSASTTFTAPAVDGDATFTLTLTAGDGTDSGSDGVDVTVKETGSAFITTWRTTSDNEAITIPGTGTYDVVWGDGTFSDAASGDGEFFDGVSGHVSHEYETPGTHTVSITGGLRWINLADNLANAQKLQSIEQWGGIKWDAMAFSFQGASNMVYNADDAPDLSEVADMTNMFRKASSFDGDLSSWDVSQATDMSGMFTSATAFDGDVSPWDVSSVTDMSIMFALAPSFNGDLSSWNVSSATGMGHMFLAANSFQQNLGNWYVVPEDTAYAIPEGTLNVTTISAQNPVLDGHSPEYGIGSGGDPDLFNMAGSTLMFEAAPSVGRHPVNVTASGSGVFGDGNSWRMLEIAVAGTDTDTTPPDITLIGDDPYTVQAGSTYADPGYSCADETDAVGDLRLELDDSGLDVNAPGTYTLTYTCTDLSGNASTDTRTVTVVAAGPPADTTDPVITLNGPSTLTITAGTAYTEQGAACTDDTDGSLQVTTTGTVDTSSPGTYTVTYACTDSSGNGSTISRTVTVVAAADNTLPTITINGDNPLTITVGSTYEDAGATCTDETDGSLPVTTDSTVNISMQGTYTVTYTCTDLSNNTDIDTRIVEVVAAEPLADTTDPVITIIGDDRLTITVGSTYEDAGATCTDDTDPAPTVTTSGTVDASSPGTYTVTYACTDSSGNGSTISRTVTVVDTTDPVITIIGDDRLTITVGSTYEDAGATCTDDTDPAPTVTTSGTVDASSPGTYTVTYACTDSSGNGSTISRTVTVVAAADNTLPTITINGDNPLTITVGSTYEDAGATCTDETDGTLTPVVTGTVDTDRPGTYTITYTCTDLSGNMATDTRTVTVVAAETPADTTDPVITINGSPELTITAGTTYTERGATCIDETDGSLQVTTTGTVNTSMPGTYTITYTCTDGSGNAAYDSRTVLVRAAEAADDTTPPRIDITGESRVRLHVGDAYAEQGARCVDDVDVTREATIQKSTVDTSSAGSYIVIYECADSSGNASLKIRHVVVELPSENLPPVITLNGPSTVTVAVGSAFDDPGATCTDDKDVGLTVTVKGGNPDTSSAGTRHIHYSCTDSDGKTDSVVRTVMVQ